MIRLSTHDAWMLVGGYVRYAMGRMSTALSFAASMVKQVAPHVGRDRLVQLRDEIKRELDDVHRIGKLLGHQCDDIEWTPLVKWLDGRLGHAD